MSLTESAFWFFALLGHGALWVELVNRSHGLGWPRPIVDAFTLACGFAVAGAPIAVAVALLIRPSADATAGWAVAYAWFSLGAGVLHLLSRIALRWDPQREHTSAPTQVDTLDLREELADTLSPSIARFAALPGNQLLNIAVEHRTLRLERLPAVAEGLRVAHLTDLHMSGRLPIEYFQRVVETVNAWRPDVVCVTGDIVEHPPQLDWVKPTLGELTPRLGAFYVLGNHDEKIDSGAIRARLNEAGLVDAAQTLTTIELEGVALTMCGDERPWFAGEPALTGEERFTLCLAHTPDRFGWAVRSGVDLMLAGHNHGGQVCVPLLGALLCPSRHGLRYANGTFRSGGAVMHAGRGTGSLFPARYNCPPEVSLLTLTRG